MRRRAAAPLVACALLGPAAPAADERPSFVFFLSDDHAERAISACGSDLVETPSIDRIAAEGVRFRNSFVANSICAPARATILTGTYSHVNGVVSNAERFDGTQPTLPALLRDAGYQTALIGKWHLKSDPVGFDHWEILPGQGSYYNPDFRTPAGTERRRGYVTDLITDAALRWLEEERDPARPFLLLVWHKAPHRAWLPGPDHLSTYDDVVFPEPPTLFDDLSGRGTAARLQEMTIARHLMDGYDLKLWPDDPDAEAWGRAWTYGRMDDAQRARWHATYDPLNAAFRAAAPTGDDLVRWKYQRYLHDYLACIASVDDGVGRVLDALEVPRGPDGGALSDRTAVVYSSDQGFYLGEHGWYDKRWLYEESLRTPLLVRGPGRAAEGSVVDALVSNVDVAPTFLDLAGVPIPARMQGRSLVPFLRGASPPDWRDAIYSQYFEGAGKAHNVHRHHGLRTDRWKLIRYDGLDEWELFDLATDPHELRSLHDAPEHAAIRDDLVARLAAMRRSLGVEEGGVPLDEVVPAGIEVPRADLARPPEEGVFTKALVLGVTSDGGYVLDGDPVGFEAVERRLRAWTDTPVPWGGPAWTEDAWSTRHVVVAADERAPWPAVARVFERG
ncbi:MAG: sulfatase/phosphatase domain-containing protein, partial [Planctomycetota bacterium JB042]